jgi:hypothetical protein
MLGGAAPRKDILQHARRLHFGERLPDLLPELAVHRAQRVLTELNVTAERPVEQRPGRVRLLRHQ